MCEKNCGTCRGLEVSDRTANGAVGLQPRLLLCLRCRAGGGTSGQFAKDGVDALAERIRREPDTCIRLESSFDEVGGRTDLYDTTTPEERKRDLDVLCRLGLVPGDERTARDLFSRIGQLIPSLDGICRYDTSQAFVGTWEECPVAQTGAYEQGKGAVIAWERTQEEIDVYKRQRLFHVVGVLGLENHDVVRGLGSGVFPQREVHAVFLGAGRCV